MLPAQLRWRQCGGVLTTRGGGHRQPPTASAQAPGRALCGVEREHAAWGWGLQGRLADCVGYRRGFGYLWVLYRSCFRGSKVYKVWLMPGYDAPVQSDAGACCCCRAARAVSAEAAEACPRKVRYCGITSAWHTSYGADHILLSAEGWARCRGWHQLPYAAALDLKKNGKHAKKPSA